MRTELSGEKRVSLRSGELVGNVRRDTKHNSILNSRGITPRSGLDLPGGQVEINWRDTNLPASQNDW